MAEPKKIVALKKKPLAIGPKMEPRNKKLEPAAWFKENKWKLIALAIFIGLVITLILWYTYEWLFVAIVMTIIALITTVRYYILKHKMNSPNGAIASSDLRYQIERISVTSEITGEDGKVEEVEEEKLLRINRETGETEEYSPGKGWIKNTEE